MNTPPECQKQNRGQPRYFHGAAIIDAAGREVPITEEMVARACEALAEAWRPPGCERKPRRLSTGR